MTSLSRFRPSDLLRFNAVNLDVLTETYHLGFYLDYLSRWPSYFTVARSPSSSISGYVMGKCEGSDKLWHGHVTAVTVAPSYRRVGLGRLLMRELEDVSTRTYNTNFVDLFVREGNKLAVSMYGRMGYVIYRRVTGYYNGDEREDAFDMRKPMRRDGVIVDITPRTEPITPDELEW